MEPEELQLKRDQLALETEKLVVEKEKLALEKRKSTHTLVQVLFGTIILGIVGLAFQWRSQERALKAEEREFVVAHIAVLEEKDPRKRADKLDKLRQIHAKGSAFLDEQARQAETDVRTLEIAERAEAERKEAEAKAAQARAEQDKREAEAQLVVARQKEAAAKKAADATKADLIRKLTRGPFKF